MLLSGCEVPALKLVIGQRRDLHHIRFKTSLLQLFRHANSPLTSIIILRGVFNLLTISWSESAPITLVPLASLSRNCFTYNSNDKTTKPVIRPICDMRALISKQRDVSYQYRTSSIFTCRVSVLCGSIHLLSLHNITGITQGSGTRVLPYRRCGYMHKPRIHVGPCSKSGSGPSRPDQSGQYRLF